MPTRTLVFLGCLALAMLTLPFQGCGDNDKSEPDRVYADGQVTNGSACPPGTTFAYRDSGYIVCDACVDGHACANGHACMTQCAPGCKDDTGSCCPVRVCTR